MIADKLRKLGHDVLAVDERRDLEGIDDAEVLGLAAEDHLIVVTFNVRDFAPLLRQFGRGREAACRLHSDRWRRAARVRVDPGSGVGSASGLALQEEWTDRAVVVSRAK